VCRAAAGLLLLAGPALAHWVSPESIIAGATDESTRGAWGVETAYRDGKAPRLLVIRVGPRWYERSPADRRTQAAGWADLWRKNVPQGIVAIVDADTAKPAVHFGPRGEVAGLLERKSPAEEGGRADQPHASSTAQPAARPGR
jgi:hypothetical protein